MAMPVELVLQQSPITGSPTSLVYGDDLPSVEVPVDPGDPHDLLFSQDPAIGFPVGLVFGDTGVAAPTTLHEVTLTAALPPPGAAISVVVGVNVELLAKLPNPGSAIHVAPLSFATVTAQLPAPGASIAAQYLTQTQRPTVGMVVGIAQRAASLEVGVDSLASITVASPAGVYSLFQEGSGSSSSATATGSAAVHTDEWLKTQFQTAQPSLPAKIEDAFGDGVRLAPPTSLARFQEAKRAQAPHLYQRFQDGIRNRTNTVQSRAQKAVRHSFGYQGFAGPARVLPLYRDAHFQDTRKPPAGLSTPPVIPGLQPCYTPSGELIFADPTHGRDLVFYCGLYSAPTAPQIAPLSILPARFYMTAHTIFAERLPDQAEVPIFDATVSADSGSYCWTLQASGPSSLFDQLAPASGLPVQLRLTLDGIPWVFAIDSISRNQSFGKTGVSLSGRSVTALIGAPYLRAVARDNAANDRLAQQLAGEALDLTGIGLDWGLTDWLVPAGAWSHQGTPLQAVQAIANAAGGYLQSHRSAPTLLTRHPYSQRSGDNPGAPWGWMTGPADVELAPDAIITQGTERRDGADINAIYVSGTSQGVLALVKRAGTAADKLAAMATDPLITHADAARQRGLATLGTAGPQYNVRLDLPVLTGVGQPGVLDVGQLVQVNATAPWRGRVRAVSVSAKRPSLRQTITLERHL